MMKKKIEKYIRFTRLKYAAASMLDKYILKQLIEVFILGVIIFTSIIFASETFTQLIKQITLFGIPFNIAIMMIILNLPQVFVMTIPISTLFATVMTVNKLSLNSEITRIARPIFGFAILMTIVSFLINEFIVPATSMQAKHLAVYSLQSKHVPDGRMNFTLNENDKEGKLKRLFYVQKCEDKTLNNITVLDLSNPETVQIIQAKFGKTDKAGWIFDGGVMYTLSTNGKVLNTTLFEKSTINFGLDNIESFIKEEANQYNFFKLMKFIQKNKKNPKILEKLHLELQVQLYDKLALPVTTFALALVGIPLAITPPRVRYNRGFLFSVMIIFVYYVIRAFSLNLGETKAISPFFAAWLPVISIAIIGSILYYRKAYKIT